MEDFVYKNPINFSEQSDSKFDVDLCEIPFTNPATGETDSASTFASYNGARIKLINVYPCPIWNDPSIEDKIISCEFCIQQPGVKLGDIFDTTPYGLIDKTYTGIGATTLELNCPRHSIIVVPTKSLAYNKYLSGLNKETGIATCCYVGSAIGDLPNTTSLQIRAYLDNTAIPHKKFLVVTDSFPKLIEAIGTIVYSEYFLMLDEIDTYQSDSTFRPALENVIDYYFYFEETHRCMVSATMQEFSHPLIAAEAHTTILYEEPPYKNPEVLKMLKLEGEQLSNQRTLTAVHTDNPHQIAVEKTLQLTQEHPNEKIVIAYNKTTAIRQIIALLPEEIRAQCGILCSEASRQNAGEYYQELTANNTLPRRITFLTCAYFAGVDIAERFHLISISDAAKIYTMLSTARLTQIAGRSRHPEGVFSETVIYSTKQYDFAHTPESLREFYLKMAQDLANYANSADVLQRRYPRALPSDFLTIKNSVAEKSSYKAFGESPVTLIRTNIEGTSVPAYMNIDAIYERLQLRLNLYSTQVELPTALQKEGHTVTRQELLRPHTDEQVRIEAEIEAALDDTADQERVQIIAELQRLHHSGELNERNLIQLRRSKSRKGQEFIDRFQRLFPYLPFDQLIEKLLPVTDDERKYRSFHNSVLFWALDNNHPFKQQLISAFSVNSTISSDALHQTANRIFSYHCDRTFNSPTTARKIMGTFIEIDRPNTRTNDRIVLSHNKFHLSDSPLQMIPATADVRNLFLFPTT